MSRFIHPAHAKGLRSPSNFSPPSTELTDRKIKVYILAGRYGKEKKEALEKELAKKPKRKSNKPTLSLSDFRHVL